MTRFLVEHQVNNCATATKKSRSKWPMHPAQVMPRIGIELLVLTPKQTRQGPLITHTALSLLS